MTEDSRYAATRGDAYRLLAACFYEPERELLLEEHLPENLTTLMSELEVPADEACRLLAEGLQQASQEELLVEYSALFLGPFGAPAHPYGSVYLEQAGLLMGDSSMAVQKCYLEAGLTQKAEGPPDHIALELEFMSFLINKAAEAEAAGDSARQQDFARRQGLFLSRFLASWVIPFANAIRAHAQLAYYRALADCLVIFIATESHRHEAAMHVPAGP
ncbi:MAG: hypothetical protein BWK76_11260 [Desulfobulbaceae bacterium A2]|nr:MAG: hypothetical protein BWK76_11260 [Desulfobulbaceae bacterium A2]